MAKSEPELRFFDRHGQYAVRFWNHIPRVGDEVILNAGKRYVPDGHGKAFFMVKRVVFGAESEEMENYRQTINIEIQPISREIEDG